MRARVITLENSSVKIFLWPSFETPAAGGLLRMRTFFSAKCLFLMVRSPQSGRLEP
jgi:hypothetical protein